MKSLLLVAIWLVPALGLAQYHSLDMPQTSPLVKETQRLGITDIEVNYSSPAVKGRNVWENLVPKNGDPIPWRIGANMNTTISFSTDVTIDGQMLEAGSYGLHAIPGEGEWDIIFATNDNLWGSYYLDLENDVALRIKVTPEEGQHSEQLDFEFKNRTDSTMQIAFEWEKLSVPFRVGVDLNETTLAHFRYQLKGATTYAWEAWDAAAQWCLNRNTNLEEALEWSERSIAGGYGGYAAATNFTNLSTKSALLWALDRKSESDKIMQQAIPLMSEPSSTYWVGKRLSDQKRSKLASYFYAMMITNFPDVWYVYLGATRAEQNIGNSQKALKHLAKAKEMAPANYANYLAELETKIKNGETI